MKNHSDELIFHSQDLQSQGLRWKRRKPWDRIGEIAFANFSSRVFAQSASTRRKIANKGVADYLGDRIIYINVLNRISIDCDCDGHPAEPDIHDIGIVASFDPVAADQACIDLVWDAEGSESLRDRINELDGLHTLEYAEQIGLGSRTYQLVNIK